jgi:flagellar biosynthesis protein FliQ
MNDTDTALMLRDGMLVMLKLGGPPLLVALAVGLVVSLLQAVTQINEATLAFVPKVLESAWRWCCWGRSCCPRCPATPTRCWTV